MDIHFEREEQMGANGIDVLIRAQIYDDRIKSLEKYLNNFLVNPIKLLTDIQGRMHRINVEKLIYIDVSGDYSTIYFSNEQLTFRMSLIEMKHFLGTEQLIQVSRHTLINIPMLLRIESSFSGNMTAHLIEGKQVSISRKYWKKVKGVLNDQ